MNSLMWALMQRVAKRCTPSYVCITFRFIILWHTQKMFATTYMNSEVPSKSLHSFRNSLRQFLPEIKTIPVEVMYIHPAQSLSCFIMKHSQWWTSPRIIPGLAWLSLMGIVGSSCPLQCSIVLVLGAFFQQEMPEQGAVLGILAT